MFERSKTEINLDNFQHNLLEILKFKQKKSEFLQIVKADAYGHGSLQISLKAIEVGASMLGVANSEEGLFLRYEGIKKPILILSPSLETEIPDIVEYNLIPSISDFKFVRILSDYLVSENKELPVHINVDTGMGRSGFISENFNEIFKQIISLRNIKIQGIFSHFSSSEDDKKYTDLQVERFKKIILNLPFKPQYVHIENSCGIINSECDFCNLVRIGILSYGIYPDKKLKKILSLKPVMTFKSAISQIKNALPGDSIGYNRIYQVNKRMKYAIIPIGYADGLDYLLSNKGMVQIRGKICPIIGKISMDMTAIDVSELNCEIGDEVLIISDKNEKLLSENIVSLYDGNPYELVCQVGRRAKRYYILNGKINISEPLMRRDFVPRDFNDKGLNKIISTAISQRMKSEELSSVIYKNILKRFFSDSDNRISYRSDFQHIIEFIESNDSNDFYTVKTKLTFFKKLRNNNFLIVCANNNKSLRKYFMNPKVEYRWLLHKNLKLQKEFFSIESASIDNIELNKEYKFENNIIKINCTHPKLSTLKGGIHKYSISTITKYPKNSHQLSIYINEITKSFSIDFIFPENIKPEIVPIFAGKTKFPKIIREKNHISILSEKDEWIFPNSGVVFSY